MIRSLTPDDLAQLASLCQQSMPFDLFFPELVQEKTFGARDFEPQLGLVFQENGALRGVLQAARRQPPATPHAWIRLLAVHPQSRNQGIATRLLVEIENRLHALGVPRLSTMDAVPNYLTPGIDFRYTEAFCFLAKHGYQKLRENMNLICEVAPEQFELSSQLAQLAQEDILIKRAEPDDLELSVAFVRRCFPLWEGELRECFYNSPITLHVAIEQGKVVGFSAYDSNNKNTGWFGPAGLDPELRGKGIGAVLTKLCLRDIALQGHPQAIIPWVGPVRFYSKVCDARIDRIFWVWEKQL